MRCRGCDGIFLISEHAVPFWTAIAALAAVATACVTSIYTYFTFKLFRAQAEPKVILYTESDRSRFAVINLVVENIGKDVAFNIKFTTSRPLPKEVFGPYNDKETKFEVMDDGTLVDGIPSLEPGGKRVITWGQFGGLSKALGGKNISVIVSYWHAKRQLFSDAILEVESYADNDGSEIPLVIIADGIKEMRNELGKLSNNIVQGLTKVIEQNGKI